MAVREGNKVHILVIPFPDGQGHINPILQFSKRLAFKGLKVTLLNVLNGHGPATDLGGVGGSVKVEHRPRAPYTGTEPEPLESHIHRLQTSTCFHLTNLLTHHQSSTSPIRCVVYDSLSPWVLDVARAFGIPGAQFFTESCAVNAIFYHVNSGSFTINPVHGSSVPPPLPALPPLRISDLPSLIPHPQQYPVFLRLMIGQFCSDPEWMFINTFHALEPQVIEWMQSRTPLKPIGPTVPSILTDRLQKDDRHYSMDLTKLTEDDNKTILEWLDSKDRISVVYVSFGSVSELGDQQTKELAWGLKAANKTFLWVIKESETPKLPSSFLEETKEMGMVVKWCSQVQVLAHESVGCFVTHCGWNSVLEGLSSGAPMVAMPQWTDQMTNAKFVEDVWKVGVRVSPKENGVVGREEIELCVRQVMEGDKSFEMRENARRWMNLAKEAVNEGGTSDTNIDEFVAQLKRS